MLNEFQFVLSVAIISIVICFVIFILLIVCLYYTKHKSINDGQIDSDVESCIIRDSHKLKDNKSIKYNNNEVNNSSSCCNCFKKSKKEKKSNRNLVNHENLLFNPDNGDLSESDVNAKNGTKSELGSSRLSCIDRELPPLPSIPANIIELNNSKSTEPDQSSLDNFNTINSVEKSPQKSQNNLENNDQDNEDYAVDVASTNQEKECKCSASSNNNKSHINKRPDVSSIAEFDPTYAMINGLSASTTPTNHNHKPAIVIPITTEMGEIEFLLVCPNCGGNMTATTPADNHQSTNNSCWTSLHDVYNNHTNHNNNLEKSNINKLAFCTPLRRNTVPSSGLSNINGPVLNNENLYTSSTYASITKLPKESISTSYVLPPKITRQRSISQSDIINSLLMQNHVRKTMTIDSSNPANNIQQSTDQKKDQQLIQQEEKAATSVWSLKCSSCASTTNIYQHPEINPHQPGQTGYGYVGVPDRKYGQSIVDMIEKLRKISHRASGSETPCSAQDGYNNQSYYTDDLEEARVLSQPPSLAQSKIRGRSSTPNFSLLSPSSSWSSSKQRAFRVLHWSPPSCQMTHSRREGESLERDQCFSSVVLRGGSSSRVTGGACMIDKKLPPSRPSSVVSPMNSVNRFLAINCARKMSPLFHPVLTPPPLSPMEGNTGLNTCFKSENKETTSVVLDVADKPRLTTMNMDKSCYYEDLSEYEKVTGVDKEVESIYSMKKPTNVEVKLDDPPPPRRAINKTKLDRPKSETDSVVYAFPNKPSKPSHLILQDKLKSDEIQSKIPINNNDHQQVGSNQSTARLLCQLPPSYQRLMSSEDSCAKSPISTEPSPLTENTILNDSSATTAAGDSKSCSSSAMQPHYIIPSSLSSKGLVKQFNWSSSISSSSSDGDNINSISIDVYETLE